MRCDERCEERCTERAAPVTDDPDSLLAALGELTRIIATCDARRDACVQCLDILRGAGVIR